MAWTQVPTTSTSNVVASGGGTNYLVETPGGDLYHVYVDANSDVAFRKSTDGGFVWSEATVVFTGTVTHLSIWYDRWSNIAAGLIHCAYTEGTNHDTLYRSINTESADALSSETTIFAGASAVAANGHLSITRARGGNLYCKTVIDAGAEGGFFRSTDVGATWGSRTVDEAIATGDMMILVPGFAADNQDILSIFWDASANEVSRKIHDDSANSWAETSIATSMTDVPPSTAFPNFAAAVDLTNSRIWLVAWSAIDTLNADLRAWHITESAITEVTNVVLNSTDDQGLCCIGIDTTNDDLYVFYGGNSDGSETFSTAINLFLKISTDDGATWGSQTKVSWEAMSRVGVFCTPRRAGPPVAFTWRNGAEGRVTFELPTAGGGRSVLVNNVNVVS